MKRQFLSVFFALTLVCCAHGMKRSLDESGTTRSLVAHDVIRQQDIEACERVIETQQLVTAGQLGPIYLLPQDLLNRIVAFCAPSLRNMLMKVSKEWATLASQANIGAITIDGCISPRTIDGRKFFFKYLYECNFAMFEKFFSYGPSDEKPLIHEIARMKNQDARTQFAELLSDVGRQQLEEQSNMAESFSIEQLKYCFNPSYQDTLIKSLSNIDPQLEHTALWKGKEHILLAALHHHAAAGNIKIVKFLCENKTLAECLNHRSVEVLRLTLANSCSYNNTELFKTISDFIFSSPLSYAKKRHVFGAVVKFITDINKPQHLKVLFENPNTQQLVIPKYSYLLYGLARKKWPCVQLMLKHLYSPMPTPYRINILHLLILQEAGILHDVLLPQPGYGPLKSLAQCLIDDPLSECFDHFSDASWAEIQNNIKQLHQQEPQIFQELVKKFYDEYVTFIDGILIKSYQAEALDPELVMYIQIQPSTIDFIIERAKYQQQLLLPGPAFFIARKIRSDVILSLVCMQPSFSSSKELVRLLQPLYLDVQQSVQYIAQKFIHHGANQHLQILLEEQRNMPHFTLIARSLLEYALASFKWDSVAVLLTYNASLQEQLAHLVLGLAAILPGKSMQVPVFLFLLQANRPDVFKELVEKSKITLYQKPAYDALLRCVKLRDFLGVQHILDRNPFLQESTIDEALRLISLLKQEALHTMAVPQLDTIARLLEAYKIRFRSIHKAT